MTDSHQVKVRETELKQKLRVTKICEDCDGTFQTFELSIGKMTHMQMFSKQRALEKKDTSSELGDHHSITQYEPKTAKS